MERSCAVCGKGFTAQRSTARYCGSGCRARASQGAEVRDHPAKSHQPAPTTAGLTDLTRRELDAAGRLDTARGAAVLLLAGRLDANQDTGSAVAALHRQWDAALTAATADARQALSPMDELRLRREARRGA